MRRGRRQGNALCGQHVKKAEAFVKASAPVVNLRQDVRMNVNHGFDEVLSADEALARFLRRSSSRRRRSAAA